MKKKSTIYCCITVLICCITMIVNKFVVKIPPIPSIILMALACVFLILGVIATIKERKYR